MIIGEFSDSYPPELDGVGAVVKNYVEEFSRLGDDCYYVAPANAPSQGDQAFQTLLFKGIRMPGEPYRVGLPVLDRQFARREQQVAFEIVHAHSPFSAGMSALHLAKRRKIPIVATFHSKYYDDFYTKTHSDLLATLGTDWVVNFYDKCDEVWTVNEKTAEVLHQYGYKREIRIMPNGVNAWMPSPQEREAARRHWALSGKPLLLYVGQMNWKKNLGRILEATALCARNHPCQLVMAGQGPDEQAIRRRASELGLDGRVLFTGHIVDRTLLMSLYACADVLVFPSRYDNAPMVVREAASAGTASILLHGSCAAEGVEDGVNGLLCEDTPESIAACIERGLAQGKSLGERARATIPVPWSEIVARARARYAELIEQSQRNE